MADTIGELLVTEAAVDRLGERGISIEEAPQLVDKRYVILRNPAPADEARNAALADWSSAAQTGGRPLTLVIERTVDPTTWLIITGWEAAPPERRIIDARGPEKPWTDPYPQPGDFDAELAAIDPRDVQVVEPGIRHEGHDRGQRRGRRRQAPRADRLCARSATRRSCFRAAPQRLSTSAV